MSIKFPDFSVDGDRIKYTGGKIQPASPELQAMAAIYQALTEINQKLDAPLLNVTNHPPESETKKK